MNTRVSIIIPAYNVENYLEECVQSCLQQTAVALLEIIVVDNNSIDKTHAIALQLQAANADKITVLQAFKKGAGAARNCGLQVAKGEWIQFLDADDLLKPEKIAGQMALIDTSHENPAFVAAAYERLKTNGKVIPKKMVTRSPFMNLLWGYGACGITSSNLWNRDLLLRTGGFDETKSSSQEARLMFDLLKLKPRVLWDTESNTVVRERAEGGQISTGKQLELTRNFFDLRKEIVVYLNTNHPDILKADSELNGRIYRSFATWLLSEETTAYHLETLAFLIENLYRPGYQWKFLSPTNQLQMEKRMRKLRNSRINQKFHLIK
ncbi:MAG: glycosyltransferase family 2 protein [Flavobacteriales bacterium]